MASDQGPSSTFGTQPSYLFDTIHIRRFRSLYDVGPIKMQDSLTVVAGQNDGGKSSFVDAIAFFLGQKSLDDRDLSHDAMQGESIEVQAILKSKHSAEPRDPIHVRATRAHGGGRVIQLLQWVHPLVGKSSIDELPIADLRRLSSQVLPASPGGSSKQPYIDALQVWLDEQPRSEFEESWQPFPREMESCLPRLQVFSTATSSSPVQAIQQIVRSSAQTLMQSQPYLEQFAGIESSLVEAIRPELTRIEQKIQDHCEDLDAVAIRTAFDFSRAQPNTTVDFLREGNAVDYTKVGEGRHRKTTLAVHEANSDALRHDHSDAAHMLVYDEPDTHLDFISQKRVARILQDQASLSQVQVIVATHSKTLIDVVPVDAVLSFRLTDTLRTQVTVLSSPNHQNELEFQSDLYASLGFSNSTLLDDKVFLVVEGPTEMRACPLLFRHILGSSMVSNGIHQISLDGNGAKTQFVKQLMSVWGKPVMILLDSESRKKSNDLMAHGAKEGQNLFFVGEKEFEDSFSDDVWIHTLQKHYPPMEKKLGWDAQSLTGPRGSHKFSNSIREKIRTKTGIDELSKVDMGENLVNSSIELNLVPEVLTECFWALRTKVEMLR